MLTAHQQLCSTTLIKKPVSGKCQANTFGSDVRYPGEDCTDKTTCFRDESFNATDTVTGKCDDKTKKCTGFIEGQACNITAQCTVGTFCKSGTCAKLAKENDKCDSTYDCATNLLCWKGTCQNVWFSQEEGTDTKASGDFPAQFYCKYGEADSKGVCVQNKATDTFDKKTGLTKCDLDQKCNYTVNGVGVQKTCSCGFNENGNAYCPKGHNADDSNWKNYNNAMQKLYQGNTKCHSENRVGCYAIAESSVTDMKKYKHLTVDGHLFQNAPDCVERLLSASFIQTSVVGFLILLAMVLF